MPRESFNEEYLVAAPDKHEYNSGGQENLADMFQQVSDNIRGWEANKRFNRYLIEELDRLWGVLEHEDSEIRQEFEALKEAVNAQINPTPDQIESVGQLKVFVLSHLADVEKRISETLSLMQQHLAASQETSVKFSEALREAEYNGTMRLEQVEARMETLEKHTGNLARIMNENEELKEQNDQLRRRMVALGGRLEILRNEDEDLEATPGTVSKPKSIDDDEIPF